MMTVQSYTISSKETYIITRLEISNRRLVVFVYILT